MGSASARLIVSILVVVGLAIGFWTLVIAPKRSEADKLGGEIQQLSVAVETAQGEVVAATAAKQEFPDDYRQLVVLGQAAPAGDETASLLVELEGIADSTGVSFDSIQLESAGEELAAAPVAAPEAASEASSGSTGSVNAAATVSPTEVAASLLPLGASIGPAGLYVMPYGLQFSGDYFEITNFIRKVDALVRPGAEGIEVDGRLVTVGGFTLSQNDVEEAGDSGSEASEGELTAALTVTTYLSPPSQGVTAGATPTAPALATSEASGSSSEPAPSAGPVETVAPTSETVSAK